jgi:hypothetical protein
MVEIKFNCKECDSVLTEVDILNVFSYKKEDKVGLEVEYNCPYCCNNSLKDIFLFVDHLNLRR